MRRHVREILCLSPALLDLSRIIYNTHDLYGNYLTAPRVKGHSFALFTHLLYLKLLIQRATAQLVYKNGTESS